jgi:flavodoxin
MKDDEARKMLVVYYSLNGATERVAKDVAAMFDADIDRVFTE